MHQIRVPDEPVGLMFLDISNYLVRTSLVVSMCTLIRFVNIIVHAIQFCRSNVDVLYIPCPIDTPQVKKMLRV